VIPADLTAELGYAMRGAVAAGELPGPAATLTAAGTWRPPPVSAGPRVPGRYATSLPLELAARTGADARVDARKIAALLAGRLAAPWIDAVQITGPGYLTVTVDAAHLTGLAARVVAAGPAAANSDALAGTRLTAPRRPDLSAAPDWPAAWHAQRDALVGIVSLAAGATVTFTNSARSPAPDSTAPAGNGPVAAAVAYHGAEAVRYALARTARPDARAIDAALGVPRDLANPFVAVRYAHASAASVRRWSAGLPIAEGGTATWHPSELLLLDAMSWLGERVAAAARRERPADLAAYLEFLAAAWLDCDQRCPALAFRGRAAPACGDGVRRRLLLADAARAALAAGLGLLGLSAPARM
jgi:arginyl-tRNA synthetase